MSVNFCGLRSILRQFVDVYLEILVVGTKKSYELWICGFLLLPRKFAHLQALWVVDFAL
jgi:hypothetical protein